ncbi:MAG: LysR family transcriptional regulator [Firmicutes bacterium]|nr:LysR family transcriptional regulator [Bacillota bacterium]
MIGINYELYKVFACVVKNGSITGASRELYISQPAVSQSIKQLEAQLGGFLFKRTPKGMELTAEGSAIYEYISRANGLIEQAQTRFAQMKDLARGEIKIGASDNICRNFLLPHIQKFRKNFPKIKFLFVNGTSNQTVDLLKTGKVDIGFVNLPVDDDEITAEPLGELHDCFVGGTDYKMLTQTPISVKDLTNHPLILLGAETNSRKFIDEFFKTHHCTAKPDIEVGSHDLLISFAELNMGISCVTKEFVSAQLTKGTLYKLNVEGEVRSRKIGVIRLKNVSLTFAAEKFVSNLKEDIKKGTSNE